DRITTRIAVGTLLQVGFRPLQQGLCFAQRGRHDLLRAGFASRLDRLSSIAHLLHGRARTPGNAHGEREKQRRKQRTQGKTHRTPVPSSGQGLFFSIGRTKKSREACSIERNNENLHRQAAASYNVCVRVRSTALRSSHTNMRLSTVSPENPRAWRKYSFCFIRAKAAQPSSHGKSVEESNRCKALVRDCAPSLPSMSSLNSLSRAYPRKALHMQATKTCASAQVSCSEARRASATWPHRSSIFSMERARSG